MSTTIHTVSDLFDAAGLDPNDTDQPAYVALITTAQQAIDADRAVVSLADELIRTATRVAAAVRDGANLNPLGEIQGAGPRLDVAIAAREARYDAWLRLTHAVTVSLARTANPAGAQ